MIASLCCLSVKKHRDHKEKNYVFRLPLYFLPLRQFYTGFQYFFGIYFNTNVVMTKIIFCYNVTYFLLLFLYLSNYGTFLSIILVHLFIDYFYSIYYAVL